MMVFLQSVFLAVFIHSKERAITVNLSSRIVAFCENEKGTDPLISRLPASSNPFRNDKGPCKIF